MNRNPSRPRNRSSTRIRCSRKPKQSFKARRLGNQTPFFFEIWVNEPGNSSRNPRNSQKRQGIAEPLYFTRRVKGMEAKQAFYLFFVYFVVPPYCGFYDEFCLEVSNFFTWFGGLKISRDFSSSLVGALLLPQLQTGPQKKSPRIREQISSGCLLIKVNTV